MVTRKALGIMFHNEIIILCHLNKHNIQRTVINMIQHRHGHTLLRMKIQENTNGFRFICTRHHQLSG